MLEKCKIHKECLVAHLRLPPQLSLPWQAGGCFNDAIKTADVVDLMLAAKRAAGRREIYLKNLRQVLARFALVCPDLRAVTVTDIERWLASSKCANSRATNLNRVSTLFAFAVRRGIVAANPCALVERVSVDRKPPAILTVAQARALLKSCPTVCRPYLVLCLFAGIRPDEVMRLDWSDINLETATVKVDGKTRQRRIVPLEPAALAWLRGHPVQRGPVAPSHSTIRRWKRQARAILGGVWTADILRHSYASFALSKYGDAGKVATMMGNSSAVLLRHYHEPVTQAEAVAFWAAFPAPPSPAGLEADAVMGCS